LFLHAKHLVEIVESQKAELKEKQLEIVKFKLENTQMKEREV